MSTEITQIQILLKDTAGRDKITKLVQYVAKLASYNLKESNKDGSVRLGKLSNAIGMKNKYINNEKYVFHNLIS